QQARATLGLLPHEIAVGTIGALVARKGHSVLIDAMGLAQHEVPRDKAPETVASRLRCFVAGAGPLQRKLAQRIADRDVSHSVTLLGTLQEAAMLLNALDIFVMPSLNEGMGVAAMEATAAGLPVVASAVGGLPEVVDDEHTGILVKPGDPAILA